MSLGLFGPIGTTELFVILFIALLMFGGRLPEVARSLGKSVNQFKRGLKDVEDEMNTPEQQAPPKTLPPPTQQAQQTAATANETTKQPQS
jgi:sec-independent protein translocase protein TatA